MTAHTLRLIETNRLMDDFLKTYNEQLWLKVKEKLDELHKYYKKDNEKRNLFE